jgi:hypothetical protein
MQRRLMAVVILYLLWTSAAVADELCRAKYKVIVTRSVDTMIKVMELIGDLDGRAIEVMAARGETSFVEPGTDIYVKEDRGGWLYLVRLPGSPDLLLGLTGKGFDCPTPPPRPPTKKRKRS